MSGLVWVAKTGPPSPHKHAGPAGAAIATDRQWSWPSNVSVVLPPQDTAQHHSAHSIPTLGLGGGLAASSDSVTNAFPRVLGLRFGAQIGAGF